MVAGLQTQECAPPPTPMTPIINSINDKVMTKPLDGK